MTETTQREEPPEGAPWDTPLAEAPLAFVDLEMTGLDPVKDRVIEVCIVRLRGRQVEDTLETLVNPGPSATFSTDVHGLGPEAVANAPSFAEVSTRVAAVCEGAIVVAHGAFWDVKFLEAEFARLGRAVRFSYYLDTLTLARRAFMAASHSLGSLTKTLGIDGGRAHRAGDDTRALMALFEKIVAELSPRSARDLWHVRVGERHARPEIVERCLTLAKANEQVRFTYRPSHKGPKSFEAIITQVRTDLDPPRVLGYFLPGRGRFDLRVDRILSISPLSENLANTPLVPSPKAEPTSS
ncbi:MAG TPA: 3'-5' exonuclease [Polyangiaceae bacterium]|nr:3'-5' exonuclease [Polyangiaceae bacterium]